MENITLETVKDVVLTVTGILTTYGVYLAAVGAI